MINKIMFKEWIRNHTAELVVFGIGLVISFVIAGGNIDALAQSRRR